MATTPPPHSATGAPITQRLGTTEASAAALPAFAVAYDEQFRKWCEVWNVPAVSPEFTSPSQGSTPTFIGVGALFPGFALSAADNLARYRPNTTVVRFATLGAALEWPPPIGLSCYRELLEKFVSDPQAPLEVAECEAQSPPIAFLT